MISDIVKACEGLIWRFYFLKGGCLFLLFFFFLGRDNMGCWLCRVYFAPFVDLKKKLWTNGVHVPRESLNKRKYVSKTSKLDSCATCLLAMICIVKDRTAYAICCFLPSQLVRPTADGFQSFHQLVRGGSIYLKQVYFLHE